VLLFFGFCDIVFPVIFILNILFYTLKINSQLGVNCRHTSVILATVESGES
jgi:hypothetical protein